MPAKEGERQKPLVFIIDELDRCRPVFALAMLERIKHFFAVPNVHFVLGVNQAQLQNSIVAAYGAGVNGQLYLQKFIHFTFHLSSGRGNLAQHNLAKFVDFLIERLDISPEQHHITMLAAEPIKVVAQRQNLNLRAIERMVMTLALSIAFIGNRDFPPGILGGLCVLKVQEPDLFEKAKRGVPIYREIRLIFGYAEMVQDTPGAVITDEWWWAAGSGGAVSGHVSQEISRRAATIGQRSNGVIAWVANEIVDRLH